VAVESGIESINIINNQVTNNSAKYNVIDDIGD